MRKRQWATIVTAAMLLAACNGQGSEPADNESTDNPAARQPTSTQAAQTPAPDATDASPAASSPSDEYANSRPPLDNSGAEPTEGSCLAELGREKAEQLSEQCYAMSPATRPPCNIQNSCEMIRKELKRGCEFGDTSDNPDYCAGV